MRRGRYFRISMTVSQSLMETIFDILKNEDAHDFRMMEVGPDGQVKPPPQPASQPIVNPLGGKTRSTGWVRKHWPKIAPVFQALNGGAINYKDMRLVKALIDTGMGPGSISATLSSLVKEGLLVRAGQGEYKLP